ncbi:MAG TPA: N-6 DNA methylase [Thermoanaerobaculia bacterium]|nr:N-6 DNA methylase [Thermoanaerobaculia bacterium]
MLPTKDIVQRLWALCHVLRDDGITYQDYITELTWLLFLKMVKETGRESQLPKGYRWTDLASKEGVEQLVFYKELLLRLGTQGRGRVQQIFANASTSLRHSRNLSRIVTEINSIDWYSAREEGLGDMYEGLLEKNASEQKSGAGQYFTPRPLIDSIVALVKPKAGEVIQDPAAGTGGFLVAANRYIRKGSRGLANSKIGQKPRLGQLFVGVELVTSAFRLCLMNAFLHGIEGNILLGDSLSPLGTELPKADVIITNPPFGTKKGGGRPLRDDFTFPTSNKQLAFLQHVYLGLKPGGRAAVILPDNVLFEDGIGTRVRVDLMDKCNLHTILRLPSGIFYAQGIKTNVLFFQRGTKDGKSTTRRVWFYDLRTNVPPFGRRTQINRNMFSDFEKAFGSDPNGQAQRRDEGESGRFRAFTREQIASRGNSLDLFWLRVGALDQASEFPDPERISAEIMANLRVALEEIESLVEVLGSEDIFA